VLLRDYPNSIRSAVLDSPLPLWVSYDETSIQFYAEKLDKLLLDCAKDSLCSAAFPDLKRRFYQFLYNANIKPISISIKSLIDSSLVAVSLYGYQVASFVELGSTWKLAGLPKMMEQLCQGDYSILQSYVASLLAPESLSMGMRLSVWCSEEYPFNKEDNVSKKKGIPAVFANMRSMAVPLAICKEWNTRKASAKENRPFRTNLPVLIINGEYDPDTPAAWGAEMQQRFVNSFHIVFKGMSHTPTQNWGNMCGMQLATQFFNQPTIRPLLPCVSMLQQLKFDTSK
jgi:pimeloyl-ACP methyl ester carboxylesterase